MSVSDKIQRIIDYRTGRGEYAGKGQLADIVSRYEFAVRMESVLQGFHDFQNGLKIQQATQSGKFYDFIVNNPVFVSRLLEADSSRLLLSFKDWKAELERLRKRFSRESIQIAFIGQARQGKSTFLQSITGLSDDTIPTSSGTDCTGAVSIIENSNDVEFAMIPEFYSESEFKRIVNSKLSHLFPSYDLKITSLAEIPALIQSPVFEGYEDNKEICEFVNTFIKGYHNYVSLIGVKDAEPVTDEASVAELVAKYKIYDSVDDIPQKFRHYRHEVQKHSGTCKLWFNKFVVVKSVKIKKTFRYAEAGKIVLVDTIGLGNATTEMEDRAKMFDVLKNESDAAVYIYKPSEDGESKEPKLQAALLKDLAEKLDGYKPNLWIVGAINKKSEQNCSKKGKEYLEYLDHLEEIKKKYNNESRVLAWSEIMDASDSSEVNQKLLLPLLDTIISNIDEIDKTFLLNANRLGKILYDEYVDFCNGLSDLLTEMVSTDFNPYTDFKEKYENLKCDLFTSLNDYVRELRNLIDEPCNAILEDLRPYVEKLSRCIPSVKELTRRMNMGGVYAWTSNVYSEHVDFARSQMLADVKAVCAASVRELQSTAKQRVSEVFFGHGRLGKFILKGSQNKSATIDWLKCVCHEKMQNYPVVLSAFDSVADFEMKIEGFIYSKCICLCEPLKPNVTSAPDIDPSLDTESKAILLQQAITEVVMRVVESFYRELGIVREGDIMYNPNAFVSELKQPHILRWCMVDTFVQELSYGKGKEELENFYQEYYPILWEYEISADRASGQTVGEWNKVYGALRSMCDINNFIL